MTLWFHVQSSCSLARARGLRPSPVPRAPRGTESARRRGGLAPARLPAPAVSGAASWGCRVLGQARAVVGGKHPHPNSRNLAHFRQPWSLQNPSQWGRTAGPWAARGPSRGFGCCPHAVPLSSVTFLERAVSQTGTSGPNACPCSVCRVSANTRASTRLPPVRHPLAWPVVSS